MYKHVYFTRSKRKQPDSGRLISSDLKSKQYSCHTAVVGDADSSHKKLVSLLLLNNDEEKTNPNTGSQCKKLRHQKSRKQITPSVPKIHLNATALSSASVTSADVIPLSF